MFCLENIMNDLGWIVFFPLVRGQVIEMTERGFVQNVQRLLNN